MPFQSACMHKPKDNLSRNIIILPSTWLQLLTPQRTVCLISQGWGGRASDKHPTEHSTLLNHLLPGDTILAD